MNRKIALSSFAVLALALSTAAAAPKLEKRETWYHFKFGGKKVGFLYALDEPSNLEGQTAIHSHRRSLITVRRLENTITMEATTDAWADPNGKPIRFKHVRMEGGAPRNVEGTREGNVFKIRMEVGGKLTESSVPLDGAVYLSSSLDVITKRDLAVGKKMEGKAIIEENGEVQPFKATVTGTENIKDGKAFIVESEVAGVVSKDWVLADGRTVRTVVERLGAEFIAASREDALALPATEDIFTAASLKTGVRLPSGDLLDEIVIDLRAKSGGTPRKPIDDKRQNVKPEGKAFRLHIKSDDPPGKAPALPIKPPKEVAKFLNETPYEATKDEVLTTEARKQIGGAKDAWEAAKLLNAFVYRHIKNKSLAKAFSTANEALASREGDCTEHAVLMSALSKIVGIPTRLVTGLVYVGGQDGTFGYHEWVEVWMGDRWIAMDPTFGQDIADPTHIKFTQGLSDPEGLREAGVAAAELFQNLELSVLEYVGADGTRKRL